MYDWIARWAECAPHRPAVKAFETGQELTYAQLNRLGNRLAHHFTHELGLSPGDRVGIVAENCLAYVVLFSAMQKTGLTLVPMNFRLSSGEFDYLLRDSQPRVMITEDKFYAAVSGAEAFASLPIRYTLAELAAKIDPQQTWPQDEAYPAYQGIEGDDPVFILYTSGTTGFPKGALYTHNMLLWNSLNTELRLHLTGDDRTLNVMPPFHTGGWNVLLTPLLHHGGFTCMMKKFDPDAVLRTLDAERCSIFMGVPTMLRMMAQSQAFAEAKLDNLRYFVVGGEAMPIPLIETWATKNIPIRQGYGMTEVGPNLFSLHQDDALRKKGSIGQPNFYVQTRIVDSEGQDLPAGQAGELWLKGPMVTPGYWQNPEATAKTIVEGWLKTGDMVVRDEEGYYFVVDRIKNMFISGGENVYPAEIERVLLQHQAIAEAAVVAVSHAKWGEVGRAYLTLHEGHSLDEAAALSFCEGKLARFKIPQSAVILPELPKNATGKIDRKALKELVNS
jgi:fatty-acyl-CoA synthase